MKSKPQNLSLTPDETLVRLCEVSERLLAHPGRRVLGICGGPGAGKSTLAMQLVERLGATAAYVPMDGFHLPHAKLEALGQVGDKGMPHTFDGAAFAQFLAMLKAADVDRRGPGYSRKIEDVVADAIMVPATAKLLITEGNYLLLEASPWDRVRPLLDRAVYLDVPRGLVETRLMTRHGAEGLFTEARNRAHIARVDLPNFDLVAKSRWRADIIISLITEA